MKTVGFIGLGNMGAPMAANLIKAGCVVTAYDMSDAALDAAEAQGAARAASAAVAAADKDAVVTMLPGGAILRAVWEEVAPAARPGAVIVDCSTVDVDSARAAHDMAASAGLLSLDAPVSGGVGGAAAGTLTFMAGGSEAAFNAAAPLLDVMGQKAVLCGGPGAGQSAKICNNMILGISMIGVCEAFNLADNLGLSRQAMFDVVSTSSGYCWSMNAYCPAPGVGPQSPADNAYQPGFAAALMLKDLLLSQQAAASVGAQTEMGAKATALYQAFVEAGHGDLDFSAMLPHIAQGEPSTKS